MAKFEIEWSLEAKEDLIDILEFYFERNQSNSYSFKLHNEIQESIELLRMYPLLGLRTDYDNVRYLIKRNYQILYEIFKKGYSVNRGKVVSKMGIGGLYYDY